MRYSKDIIFFFWVENESGQLGYDFIWKPAEDIEWQENYDRVKWYRIMNDSK